MATNSMREHREKMLAQKAIKQAQSQDPRLKKKATFLGMDLAAGESTTAVNAVVKTETGVENIELRMFNHLNQLKDTRSIQEKIAKKKEWLPEYRGYIEGCLAVSPAEQNNTLVYLMIWAVDAGEYELAVRIAEYAILNEMTMPDGYTRGIAEFVTEQSATDFIDDQELAVANADLIQRIVELGVGEQMVDEVRAKIFRALGDALFEAQPAEALTAYKNALRLNVKAGCKKQVTQLEKLLNRQANESSPDATVGSQADASADPSAGGSVPASTDTNAAAPTAEANTSAE
ncbi:phage terminase small subunit [Acinetobacter sp. WZC-1]|uniref:phage terminase small subunit n=1 Tax=Acinetobacter sp. WZC-1 TaxID=3459034 RepID=UPI00403E0F6C